MCYKGTLPCDGYTINITAYKGKAEKLELSLKDEQIFVYDAKTGKFHAHYNHLYAKLPEILQRISQRRLNGRTEVPGYVGAYAAKALKAFTTPAEETETKSGFDFSLEKALEKPILTQ
jgi:hypothetical protein